MAIQKPLLAGLVASLLMAQCAFADLVTASFNTKTGSASGAFYSLTVPVSQSGVTFDATLSVIGSGNIHTSTAGLGVVGNGPNAVSNGEFLYLSMSVANVVGGTASFDGFKTASLTSSGVNDTVVFSLDPIIPTTGDNFYTGTNSQAAPINIDSLTGGNLPQSFFAIAAPITPGDGGNAFRLGGVIGQFTVAAVPEPTAFLFGSLVAGSVGMVVARRRRARK
ncbi:hypothetical protein Pla123a_33890 [Posidoniimonas polymericola]|uniref:PEP-CTERM protein-sorting domain-containing protein n=1 Tax=Posidoniimonas polymericola TaxID=2528002 RepID=A0A5C5YHU6_9BACT|nr:hypothetical protein [Posidoniimonas polymericola]TWT74565.1 hypothetical protein Pla123a_33890 [Posidoniimonas polymericola]